MDKMLRNQVTNKLKVERAAFRAQSSTNVNISIVNILVERMGETWEKLYITFIDLRAAFVMTETTII